MQQKMQRHHSRHTLLLWCMGLLLVSCLHAAQAQAGYDFGSYGAAGTYGQYGYGTYGYGKQLDDVMTVPESAIAVGPQDGRRRLLADEPQDQVTADLHQLQASEPVDALPSNSDTDTDIILQELPVTNAWDSLTWQSWEDWFAEHVGGSTTSSGSTTGHYGDTGAYGYSDDSQYGYGSGTYGAVGAYFDFRSNKAYIPEVIHADTKIQQQPRSIQEQGAMPDAATSSSNHQSVSVSHVNSLDRPTVAGVSRGRGLAVQQYMPPSGSTDMPGQQALSESAQAVQLALLEPPVLPVLPYRRLLSVLGGFNRRLHMNREAAEEALWAFRQ